MQLKTLKEIIKKKENRVEFAIITNLESGNSEIFEAGKSISKDFEKHIDQINNFLSFIISMHSLTTADSTQPPETDPEKSPFSLTIILLPVGLGEDPQV